jgi:hypothetical protein
VCPTFPGSAATQDPVPHGDDVPLHRALRTLRIAFPESLDDLRVLAQRRARIADALGPEVPEALNLAPEGVVGAQEEPVARVLGDQAVELLVGDPELPVDGEGDVRRRLRLALRALTGSITKRAARSWSISSVERGGETRYPFRATLLTSPVDSSRASASRTGVAETWSSRASPSMLSAVPGASFPSTSATTSSS